MTSIKQFDVNSASAVDAYLIISNSSQERLTLLKDILYSKRSEFKTCVCISSSNKEYLGEFIVDDLIRVDESVEEFSSKFKAYRSKQIIEDVKTGLGPHYNTSALVFDNCIKRDDFKSVDVQSVFKQHRTYGIGIFLLCENMNELTPDIRSVMDYVILGKQLLENDKELVLSQVYDKYLYGDDKLTLDELSTYKDHLIVSNKRLGDRVMLYTLNNNPEPFLVGTEFVDEISRQFRN